MTLSPPLGSILDPQTILLARLAAVLAAGTEADVRAAVGAALEGGIPHPWGEELMLQTYLFAGFPRALNGTREWRRQLEARGAPRPAPEPDRSPETVRADGERTCAVVYGPFYEKLRANIRALHPLLDDWMITEGYGKVLSRPGLDLARRECCIVAACLATGQDRQLHSHLHGALHAGVTPADLRGLLDQLAPVVPPATLQPARLLLARVLGKD